MKILTLTQQTGMKIIGECEILSQTSRGSHEVDKSPNNEKEQVSSIQLK